MSGSSSTTRMRWVIPDSVLMGWHEYRGRAGSTGTPALLRSMTGAKGLRRLRTRCGDQHLLGALQHLATLLLADTGRLVAHAAWRDPPAGRRHLGAGRVPPDLE